MSLLWRNGTTEDRFVVHSLTTWKACVNPFFCEKEEMGIFIMDQPAAVNKRVPYTGFHLFNNKQRIGFVRNLCALFSG